MELTKIPRVFISYRTADSEGFARDLQHFLQTLGLVVDVGKDTAPLEEWKKTIPGLIERADLFLAVIGKQWARPNPPDGKHDIKNQDDVVRMEVEIGLQKSGRSGAIMLDGTKLKSEDLPDTLKMLTDRQWTSVSSDLRTVDGLAKLTAKIYELQPKPIVLLSSTLAFLGDATTTDGLTYFVTLVVSLLHALESEREVILRVPSYGGKNSTKSAGRFQCELLQQICDESHRYSGIIIVPFETGILAPVLRALSKSDREFPVVTIDKVYSSDDPYFAEINSKPPAGVACDGRHNGALAATCIIEYLQYEEIARPNVVILQGLEGSRDRILGFIERVKTHNANADAASKIHLNVSEKMPFLSKNAGDKARAYLRKRADWDVLKDPDYQALLNGQPPKRPTGGVDAFFCCNDEMALGVCEELDRALQVDNILHATVVVGFDGIPEVTRALLAQSHWLLNTIDVNLHLQVDRLVERFVAALKAGTKIEGPLLIRGEQFLKDQDTHMEVIRTWRKAEEEQMKRRLAGG